MWVDQQKHVNCAQRMQQRMPDGRRMWYTGMFDAATCTFMDLVFLPIVTWSPWSDYLVNSLLFFTCNRQCRLAWISWPIDDTAQDLIMGNCISRQWKALNVSVSPLGTNGNLSGKLLNCIWDAPNGDRYGSYYFTSLTWTHDLLSLLKIRWFEFDLASITFGLKIIFIRTFLHYWWH